MAVGIRRIRGQTSAVKPCACSAANCVRLRRRDVDALGRFVRSAFGTCVWRTLAGGDPLARKRPAKRTKARAPSEHSSASTATSRRERPRSSPIHNEQREGITLGTHSASNKPKGLLWYTHSASNKQLIPHQTNQKTYSWYSHSASNKQVKPLEFQKCLMPEPRQRPRAQHAKETPGNLEGCEADERPLPRP
jgi:hypothetical protein